VNFVWNDCNEGQRHALSRRRAWQGKWLSYEALASLTAGATGDLDLHSHTIGQVCRAHVKSRQPHKILGWVAFDTGHFSFDGKAFTFRGVRSTPMHLRDVIKPDIRIGAGSFNQYACGAGTSMMRSRSRAPCARPTPVSAQTDGAKGHGK
jgi:hypothetical protein